MKAACFDRVGPPEVLRYGEVPDPVAGEGEVVVDVHAASVNGADWKVRSGQYKTITRFPYVPGRDFSGVIASVGTGVTYLQPGMAVFGVCETADDGGYAEQVAVRAGNVVAKPDWLSHIDAAAVALIGLTAIVSVEQTLALQSGERILIHGGAGGVGGFAVQLAKHLGAEVITTASAGNHDYVRALGADTVIDYRSRDFTRCVQDCDAVLDTIGGDVAERSFQVLKPGGRAAFIGSGPKAPPAPRDDVRSLRPQVARDRATLQRIVDLLASKAVRVPEVAVMPLQEAARAHAISEARHLRGKLVFSVRP